MRRRTLLGIVALTVAVALCLPRPGGSAPLACKGAEIRVAKGAGTVELVCDGKVLRTFSATFGASPVGPKEREGDERTPEGTYRVTSRVKTQRFHRFLGISYPNDADKKRGREQGIAKLGGGIGVHGVDTRLAAGARAWTRIAHGTGLHRIWGPTDGCIGLVNEDIEVLFDAVPVGAKVVIAP